jgi:hypothetical protein
MYTKNDNYASIKVAQKNGMVFLKSFDGKISK